MIERRYLVPRRFSRKMELFPGWYFWPQGVIVAVGAAVGLVLSISLVYGMHLLLLWGLVAFAIPVAICVTVVYPISAEGCLVEIQMRVRRYGRSQHRYLFRWRREV